MSLTVQVVPILDSRDLDISKFTNLPIFEGNIANEVLPPPVPSCFLGAWYRKVFSSSDRWLGIEGTIELGEFIPDEARFNLDGTGRYMDVPSIYMGGKSVHESDAGLGLNLTYLSADITEDLVSSSPKLAYRPFWRYIYQEALDISGNVTRREINSWNVSNPRSLMYYYFPGDVVRMSVYSPLPHYLQLRIEVVAVTDIPKYVELRKSYHLANDWPADFYSPIFYSKGHGIQNAEFKRVNAIDQFGNEGYFAKPTKANVSTATWRETFLYREINQKLVKVPFSTLRQTAMLCPSEQAITAKPINEEMGGESIAIHPGLNK